MPTRSEALKLKKLARALDEGDKSGVFKGDATAAVMKELGLDRLGEQPARASRRRSAK